ncbi:MAG: GNAT family N-acetyltransferase [Burkholderiales bacterium]|nr:GNAT family N-acetyltransferase [Burkholderiales bacterium]
MQIVPPTIDRLPAYAAALRDGYSPDNVRGAIAAQEILARIDADAQRFIESMEDREARGPLVTLPDRSQVKRIPGFHRWMWDDDPAAPFCGAISVRWQPGSVTLPPHVLGHIGYSVVPWKRRRGYATEALAQLLVEIRDLGLPHVDITTDPDNVPSQRVILANGGVFVEAFTKPAAFGEKPGYRYRISLDPPPTALQSVR